MSDDRIMNGRSLCRNFALRVLSMAEILKYTTVTNISHPLVHISPEIRSLFHQCSSIVIKLIFHTYPIPFTISLTPFTKSELSLGDGRKQEPKSYSENIPVILDALAHLHLETVGQ
jgi:hypothetical protein